MITQDVCPRPRTLAVLAALVGLLLPASAQAATFDPPMSYPVGGVRPLSVAVGDLSGDAVNDLAVANNNSNSVSVLAGRAGGGFDAAVAYPLGGGAAPSSVAVADLDGDSRLDLAVANRGLGTASILLGKAGGGFNPSVSFAAGNQPFAIAVADMDKDGHKDLVVANKVSDDVSLLLGDGAGGFAPAVSVPAGDGPISLALGDLDEDGDADAALALEDGDMMSILLNDGHGAFAAPALYTAGNGPQSVSLGDLREDGHLDIAVANFFNDYASVFLAKGAGLFEPQQGFGAGDGPRSLDLGDMDGDKHLDMAIADANADSVTVMFGDGKGDFGGRQDFPAGDAPSSIAIAQLNGAGLPDIVVADRFGEVVSILNNAGTPPPPPDTTAPVITTPGPMTVDATSAAGAAVVYSASVTDNVDAAPQLACDPASGTTFAPGTTTVLCNAEDEAGNTSSASFTVTVVPLDMSAPVINTPAAITVNATSPTGAVVTYSVTATDDRDANPSLTCAPASGSRFAIGTTTVSCTAKDAAGNASRNSFTVRVKGAPEQIVDLIDKVLSMRGLGPVAPAMRTQLESIATCVIAKRTSTACLGVSLFSTLAKYAASRGYITTAQADSLIADVTRIKAVIGCP